MQHKQTTHLRMRPGSSFAISISKTNFFARFIQSIMFLYVSQSTRRSSLSTAFAGLMYSGCLWRVVFQMCALVNFPSWGVPSVIAVARVLIFIDDISPSPLTCIITECTAKAFVNSFGSVDFLPAIGGEIPNSPRCNARWTVLGASFLSAGDINISLLIRSQMASTPVPCLPFSDSGIFPATVAALNAAL